MIDYSTIAYNIEGIPEEENCIERFPDLMLLAHVFMADDVPPDVNPDKALRYLIYMFAPGTPLIRDFPHIERRKKYVFNKLNIHFEDGSDSGYAQMGLMNESWIIERFIAFTRLQRSEDYSIMATAEIRMGELQRSILSEKISKATDDTNYQKGLEGWRDALVKARERIMAGENSIKAQQAVTFSVRAETLGIQPEEYARAFREKGEVFPEIIP